MNCRLCEGTGCFACNPIAERDTLRSELAALRAPAERFDAATICAAAKHGPDEAWCVCVQLRTAYARGAQDQGAAHAKAMAASVAYAEHLRIDRDEIKLVLETQDRTLKDQGAEIERLRGSRDKLIGLLKESVCRACGRDTYWTHETVCKNEWHRGLDVLASLSPAPSPSPVDSLTGEAGRCGPCAHGDPRSEDGATHYIDGAGVVPCKKQPVEAEQPKRVGPCTCPPELQDGHSCNDTGKKEPRNG